ncbi:MAG TPA: PhzF family phenazine biosynthesis protein [Vicinamibacterales bacterium]|nr:PhzF family phenazine biosynthesis protein [Vicinamibacterales bacterium]
MELPIFQVDAFADRLFAGNPAAVVVLPSWLPADTMLAIAGENNLAETAFVVPESDGFGLRWFTPEVEVDLCGHATLAAAWVLFNRGFTSSEMIRFQYQGGTLTVARDGDLLAMDLPARPATRVPADPALAAALGATPIEVHQARDLMAVLPGEADVRALRPDFAALGRLETFAVIVTARGTDCDFVSRFFAPRAGIPEDPVTGSAHCTLVPYWSRRLGRPRLHARQVSRRGGDLFCEDRDDRVRLSGRCIEYLRGQITV